MTNYCFITHMFPSLHVCINAPQLLKNDGLLPGQAMKLIFSPCLFPVCSKTALRLIGIGTIGY